MVAGAHRRPRRRSRRRLLTRFTLVTAATTVVVAAATGATYAVHHLQRTPAAPAPAAAPTTTTTVAPAPLEVDSITPVPGSTGVAANSAITVTFSAPLAPGAAHPTITPSVPGKWSQGGDTLTFTPQGGFAPYSTVAVGVPAGVAGTSASHTTPLAAPRAASFHVAAGSTLRLQQLLAELGYLPVTFTPAGWAGGQAPLDSEPTTASLVASSPVAGAFAWRFPNTPASLKALWSQGTQTVLTKGAVMAFESDHGLATDGVAGPEVWNALLAAVAARQVATRPYNYLMVSESLPEKLTVWSNGSVIATSLANTGVAGATTATGAYPVYARYASTTMSGTNPNGTKYHDPGVPWVAYFNGGDAVHGFPRASYGWPQSNGCVELPIATAKVVWGMDPIGTLVSIS